MNTDFRVAVSFFENPKTLHLMKCHGDRGVVCLIRLWAYVAEHRPDGRLGGLSDADVEARAGWTGPPGMLLHVLLQVPEHSDLKFGFLERTESGLVVHDWHEHNGWASAAAIRQQIARLGAAARWRKVQGHSAAAKQPAKQEDMQELYAPSPSPAPNSREGQHRSTRTPETRQPASPPVPSRDPRADQARRFALPRVELGMAGSLVRRAELYDLCRREGLSDVQAREESYRRFLQEQATTVPETSADLTPSPDPTPEPPEPPDPASVDEILP